MEMLSLAASLTSAPFNKATILRLTRRTVGALHPTIVPTVSLDIYGLRSGSLSPLLRFDPSRIHSAANLFCSRVRGNPWTLLCAAWNLIPTALLISTSIISTSNSYSGSTLIIAKTVWHPWITYKSFEALII